MRLLAIAILTFAFSPSLASAQSGGGFLFSYRPHEDARGAFDEGYRRHLDWHRERADSLAWWGWDVLAGPGAGDFVDGVFGIAFAALDARVDPAGDAADAAETFVPHASGTGRELVILRADLSTATPLEERRPTRFVQVVRFLADPRDVGPLDDALASLQRDAAARGLLPYTVYENGAGSPPGFLVMIWRDSFASFDRAEASPARALREYLRRAPEADPSLLAGPPIEVIDQVWVRRPDLTYIPGSADR